MQFVGLTSQASDILKLTRNLTNMRRQQWHVSNTSEDDLEWCSLAIKPQAKTLPLPGIVVLYGIW